MENEGLKKLLLRTTLNISFEEFLLRVSALYPTIGKIERYEPILEGYEDANVKIFTTTGIYVVKIFLKKRSLANVMDYVQILQEAHAIGVPTIQLVSGKGGLPSFIEENGIQTPFFITKLFDGDNFSGTTPTFQDMQIIASSLAKLNTLDFEIDETYDSWGNRHVVAEYEKNKEGLTQEQNELVAPIIEELKKIDLTVFPKVVIHGDMQRKHVLKNTAGEYCILDFGCMGNAPRVIDISIFLAWFCLAPDTWSQRQRFLRTVLDEYAKVQPLSKQEQDTLPILVKATYAAYYIQTAILILHGDTSNETKQWHKDAEKMLHLTKEWK